MQTWYEDGSHHLIKNYVDNVPIGEQKEFFPKDNDKLNEPSKLAKSYTYNPYGQLQGEQRTFYPSGLPQSLIVYDNGELNGVKSMWDPEGNLIEEAFYKAGNSMADFLKNLPMGKKLFIISKTIKKKVCTKSIFPLMSFGKIKALEANFINDKVEGEVIEFNEAGAKISSTFYINGKKEGLARVFTPKGKLYMTINFLMIKKMGQPFSILLMGVPIKRFPLLKIIKREKKRPILKMVK